MMEYRPWRLLSAWAAALVGAVFPWTALALGLWMARGGDLLGLGLALGSVTLCALMPPILNPIVTLLRVRPCYVWLLPVASLIYCLAATWSALRHHAGLGIAWKQRRYGQSGQRPSGGRSPPDAS